MSGSPPDPAALAAAGDRLPVVLYDGACVFCTRQAETARRLARGRVRVAPLQDELTHLPWVDPEEAVRAMQLVDRDGRAYAGAAAVVRLLRLARPWLGALALAYHLPGVRQLADRAYAAVAARRYAIAGGVDPTCADGVCGVPWADRAGTAADGVRAAGDVPNTGSDMCTISQDSPDPRG